VSDRKLDNGRGSGAAPIDELERRRTFAAAMGGPENVARQHTGGRLTVRERIERITDEGSLREVGTLAGTGEYGEHHVLRKVTPAPYVAGLARIDGRPVAIGGEDFTVRGGTSFGALRRKGGQGGYIEDLAHHYKIPLVNLIDGAGGTVTSAKRRGYVVFPGVDGFERSVELLGEVPVISAVLGTAAGGPAGRAILSHFSVMVRGTSQIFAAGPPVVKRSLGQVIDKEELGGAAVAVDEAGSVHNAVESEDDAFDQIRRFLSFMPQNVWELPPVLPVTDPVERREEALLDIVPESRTRFRDQPYLRSRRDYCPGAACRPPGGAGRQQSKVLWRRHGRRRGAQADPFHGTVRHLPHPIDLLRRRPGVHGRAES
jgi:acetyl-CoA carboxylase carboxyltransferase component